MKYIYFLFFLFVISCSTSKKVYMCGDQVCLDKKEFKEYFAQTLILEVQIKNKKKSSSNDLVKLNTNTGFNDKKKISANTQYKKNNKREEKNLLKIKRAKLKEERKIIKIKEKNRIKEEKKLAKINKAQYKKKKEKINAVQYKKKENKTNKVSETFMSTKSNKQKSLCSEIADCDIDKIFDILIKEGGEKNYPNITSK